MTEISEIGGDDFIYSPSQEKELNATDSKTKVFVLSLLALCAASGYAYHKRKSLNSVSIEPMEYYSPLANSQEIDRSLASQSALSQNSSVPSSANSSIARTLTLAPPSIGHPNLPELSSANLSIARSNSLGSSNEDDSDSSEPSSANSHIVILRSSSIQNIYNPNHLGSSLLNMPIVILPSFDPQREHNQSRAVFLHFPLNNSQNNLSQNQREQGFSGSIPSNLTSDNTQNYDSQSIDDQNSAEFLSQNFGSQSQRNQNDSPVSTGSQSECDPDSSSTDFDAADLLPDSDQDCFSANPENGSLPDSRYASNQEANFSNLHSSSSGASSNEGSQNHPPLASSPALPPVATSSNLFALRSNQIQKNINAQTQKNIATVRAILKTIEATPLLDLRKKQQELQDMGKTIASLHPFNFLAYAPHVEMSAILSSKNVAKNILVFGEITGGLKRSMESASKQNQLIRYVDQFIQDFQIDYDLSMPCPGTSSDFLLNQKSTPKKDASLISALIKDQEWEVLLKYLFVPGKVNQSSGFFGKLKWEFIPS